MRPIPSVRSRSLPEVVAAAVLLLHVAPAQVVRLTAVADATTDQTRPTVNLGADPELSFGKVFQSGGTPTVWFLRGHVQFDLTGVMGTVPQRATLSWYQSRSSAAGCLDVTAHRVTAPWSESAVTWSNQPAHDAAVAARVCVGNSFDLGWKRFDVTALAQAWLAGTQPNFGIVIRDPTETTAGAARPGYGDSRESPNTTRVPYLELDYGSVFGTGCATAGAPPSLAFRSGAPRTGSSFTIATQGLAIGVLPALALGFSNVQWGSTPLPLSLAALGYPGCDLLVAADAFVTFGLLAQPVLDVTLPVPNDTALAGSVLYLQTAGLGATSLQLSNGLGVPIY